jgi:hypothetical protein
MTTDRNQCAHDGCHCELQPETAVVRGDKAYCSERCVDNRGCDHKGCNCGVFPKQEPART